VEIDRFIEFIRPIAVIDTNSVAGLVCFGRFRQQTCKGVCLLEVTDLLRQPTIMVLVWMVDMFGIQEGCEFFSCVPAGVQLGGILPLG
jgi:hypothetical protein